MTEEVVRNFNCKKLLVLFSFYTVFSVFCCKPHAYDITSGYLVTLKRDENCACAVIR